MTKGKTLNPSDKKAMIANSDKILNCNFMANFDLDESYLLKIDNNIF